MEADLWTLRGADAMPSDFVLNRRIIGHDDKLPTETLTGRDHYVQQLTRGPISDRDDEVPKECDSNQLVGREAWIARLTAGVR